MVATAVEVAVTAVEVTTGTTGTTIAEIGVDPGVDSVADRRVEIGMEGVVVVVEEEEAEATEAKPAEASRCSRGTFRGLSGERGATSSGFARNLGRR